MTWHPYGVLDDRLLDDIFAWVLGVEGGSRPFDRFIDFGHLARVSIQIGHVFRIARGHAEGFGGVGPIKSALFSDTAVGFGIARLYETLMENTVIQARAFRDLTAVAEWLAVPVEILQLKDVPALPTKERLPNAT
jgi:hypothetical protein